MVLNNFEQSLKPDLFGDQRFFLQVEILAVTYSRACTTWIEIYIYTDKIEQTKINLGFCFGSNDDYYCYSLLADENNDGHMLLSINFQT